MLRSTPVVHSESYRRSLTLIVNTA
jgi:hypothetical protein